MATARQTADPSYQLTRGAGASEASGFIIVDAAFRPVAYNAAAVQIFTFASKLLDRSKLKLETHIAGQIKILMTGRGVNSEAATEFVSGKRKYSCRVVPLKASADDRDHLVVLLERRSDNRVVVERTANHFKLTPRERQVVQLLMEGLTTKEIAARLKITSNTVKAFLRVVMVRMGVSTRSGIVGKFLEPNL
jgi:DNA-binding CsgD family transcriptional regulator